MTFDRAVWLARIVTIVAVIPLALIFGYAHRPGDFAGYLIVGELGLIGQDIRWRNPADRLWYLDEPA
jgi:hypothetical protein